LHNFIMKASFLYAITILIVAMVVVVVVAIQWGHLYGPKSSTFSTTIASANSSNIIVTPQAPTPNISVTLRTSSPKLDVDQQEVITGTMPFGGTSLYSYKWLISYNNGGTYTTSDSCDINSGTGEAPGNSVMCIIPANTLTTGQNYVFELQATNGTGNTISTYSAPIAVAPLLTAPAAPLISAPAIYANQQETVTATLPRTGTIPYSYSWYVSTDNGTFSSSTECTANTGSGPAGSTVNCTIPANTLAAGNSYNFALQVTDSAVAGESISSAPSDKVTVFFQPSTANTITVSSPKLDVDQQEVIIGTMPANGTALYSYSWLVSDNGGTYASSDNCMVNSGSGQKSGNYVMCIIPGNALTVGQTYGFELQVNGSIGGTAATYSIPTAVTVASQLIAPAAPLISAPMIYAGQQEVINATLPGTGTPPYSYSWHVSADNGTFSSSTECTTNAGSGQAPGSIVNCTIPSNTLTIGNGYNFKIEVADSATAAESAISEPSNVIIVPYALARFGH
jgi:hypothetical protein